MLVKAVSSWPRSLSLITAHSPKTKHPPCFVRPQNSIVMLLREENASYGPWRRPTPRNIHPFREARPLLAFNINNVGVAFAATPNTILLRRIRCRPIIIFFFAFLRV